MTNRSRIHRWLLLSALGMTLAVGIGSLSGWVPAMLAALANVDVEPVVGGGDFEMFWTAAGLAAEGDWAIAYDLDGLAAAMDAPVDSVSFAYPPPLAQVLRPLTRLDYPIALASWLGIGVLALLTVLITGGRAAAIGIVAMLFSLYVALRFGQLAPLTMLCAYLGGRAIQADRRFLGGALLGLLVLKPQFVLGPMIVILATAELRRRVLAGVVASVGTVVGLSLVISPEGWSAWLSGLSEITSPAVSTRWDFSIRAVTDWIPSWGSPVASVLLGGVVIWVALRSASRTEDLTVKLAVGLCLSLLLSPRLVNYDWTMLIPAVAWVAPRIQIGSPLVPAGAAVTLTSLSGFVNVSWTAWAALATFIVVSAFAENSFSNSSSEPTGELPVRNQS